MTADWTDKLNDEGVRANLADISACRAEAGKYAWDAQGLGGVLSFVQFYVLVRRGDVRPPTGVDLSFLDDELLIDDMVLALEAC